MELRSLAYFTDLELLRFEGRVEDRGEYIVAETPGNPGYFWGNLLVMREIPDRGDLARWTELFRKEFAHQPLVKHMTFGWDSPVGEQGEVQEFLDAGFQLERSIILTTSAEDLAEPGKFERGAEVRPLTSDADWEAAIANQVACRSEGFREEVYLPFKRTQMERYRRMTLAGLGHWYGAFLDGKANRLVMAADPDYHAAKVYESVGFSPTQRQVGLYKFPEAEWKS